MIRAGMPGEPVTTTTYPAPDTCTRCGAVLIVEDCPNYGNGPEHSPV